MKLYSTDMSIALFMIVAAVAIPVCSQNGSLLPYLDLPMDCAYEPMPVVLGVSQTNRCTLYMISNGLYRAATTPETFWLFVDEKTNLWHEAVSNSNARSAIRLSQYYSLSLNDEVQSLKWLAAALALGHKKAADHIEASATYRRLKQPLSEAFALTSNEIARLILAVEQEREWQSALRLALYYGFTEGSHTKKLRWLKKAEQLGSPIARYYINLLTQSHGNTCGNEPDAE